MSDMAFLVLLGLLIYLFLHFFWFIFVMVDRLVFLLKTCPSWCNVLPSNYLEHGYEYMWYSLMGILHTDIFVF